MCGTVSKSDTDMLGIISLSIPPRGWRSKAMLAAEGKAAGGGGGDEVVPAGRATRGGGGGGAAAGGRGGRDSRHIQYSVLGA